MYFDRLLSHFLLYAKKRFKVKNSSDDLIE